MPCGFNPLPLPKQGEMSGKRSTSANRYGFNPLPLPKQGEIATIMSRRPRWPRFNPLPLPKQGEIQCAPQFQKGRQQSMFQSAPLTEARGDLSVPAT